jgi:hypothetical protein
MSERQNLGTTAEQSLAVEPNYAVLCDLDTPELRPVGLVVERDGWVQLILADDYGLKKKFTESFMTVVGQLSRTFLVTHIGASPQTGQRDCTDLLPDDAEAMGMVPGVDY